jgi:dihydroorotase
MTGARYHVAHVSSGGAVRILREAKSRGLKVTAEVTPHHLLLTEAAVLGYDTACKVNPPLRSEEDVAELRAALADGTIDAIATDHAPHSPLEKDCEFGAASPGIVGLETCFPLLLGLVRSGALSLKRLLEALTVEPARVVGLVSPSIAEGVPAAFAMIEPERSFTIEASRFRSKSANTPFLGREVTGMVALTMSEGAIIFDTTEEA